jgi:DNA-binding transcriptional LysR family regulator
MLRIVDMHVANFDLNLLKTLDAVLETRSVTGAARRLGLSQPAASHALARLRTALGDPVLVRVGARQVLTEHAEGLRDKVRDALERAEAVLAGPAEVEPAKLRRTFVLNLGDYVELTVLPQLTERLARDAPGVSLVCRRFAPDALAALEAGADLWFGVEPTAAPGVMAQKLFHDTYGSAVRRGHPLARKRTLSVKDLTSFRHLQIAPGGQPGGPLDDALAELGTRRDVALRLPDFLAAPLLVKRTDLVLTGPRRLLDTFAPLMGLVVFEPPVRLSGFTIEQAWLARANADPMHRWFRALVHRLCNDAAGRR